VLRRVSGVVKRAAPAPQDSSLCFNYPLQDLTAVANPEHLKIIQLGVDAWNQWRLENFDTVPDLSGADLSNLKLHYAQLHAANLERANCWKAELIGADLQGANLAGTNLRKAELQAANLSFSTLTEANMEGAKMATTILGANDLSGVNGLEDVRHSALSIVGIETIYRSNGAIPETFLRGCGVPEHFITYARSLTTQAIDFYSCFISYSSKDQDFAERLHADLQSKGVRCWFAPHDLPIGAKIRPAIDESIRLYDKLLLVLSQNSVSSQWVEQEVETALAKEREREGETVLFPIRIDDAVMESHEGWPALLKNTRNVGDFTRWEEHESYSIALERLLRDLKAKT
jgi:uncharacterized protein YjbI with pentapeptide repeats